MARVVTVLALVAALAGLGRIAEAEIVGHAETRASDALPLYLSGAAVSAGLDPTQERSLAKVYDERALSVGAATFSTLYPATTGVLLQPLAALSWGDFTTVWRWILLAATTAFGLAAAAVVRGDRWTRLAWGGAVVAVLAWHPVTAECVRLGQINLVLGALCALAMAAVVRSEGSWGGGRAPPASFTPRVFGAVSRPENTRGPVGGAPISSTASAPSGSPPGEPSGRLLEQGARRDPRSGVLLPLEAGVPAEAATLDEHAGGALRGGGAPLPQDRPLASRWGLPLVAGALLGLGGALKLVPAALLLPLLATRRWRPAVATAAVGLVALGLAVTVTPLPQVVAAVLGTLKFQSSIDPDWLVGDTPAPAWMRLLGWIRHEPLQWLTLGAAAIVPFARPSARTAVAGMALLTAWLGADAAGFHVLYAPLAYPVFVLLAGQAALFAPLVAVFFALGLGADVWGPASLGPEPRMVVFGMVAWGAAAIALGRAAAAVAPGPIEADPEAKQAGLALAGVVTGALLVGAVPGEGPVAAPLPEGQTAPEGPGFIHPNDRVPGEVRALGGGLDRPASTLARPGTIRALQLYMRRAPVAWTALAERYPARAALMRARASAAPGGDLRDHSGRAVAAWLTEEESVVARLQAEGLDLGDLPAGLTDALKSGLTDPALETRIPE